MSRICCTRLPRTIGLFGDGGNAVVDNDAASRGRNPSDAASDAVGFTVRFAAGAALMTIGPDGVGCGVGIGDDAIRRDGRCLRGILPDGCVDGRLPSARILNSAARSSGHVYERLIAS